VKKTFLSTLGWGMDTFCVFTVKKISLIIRPPITQKVAPEATPSESLIQYMGFDLPDIVHRVPRGKDADDHDGCKDK